jgi:Ni/Co efflux regulator RcnB
MKKFAYIIAAVGVFAIAAPSIASAQDVGRDRIGAREHRGDFREHREFRKHHAEFREHRRHRHGDRVVVVKRPHREY